MWAVFYAYVKLNFRTKRNGIPVLSKKEIEDLAEIVLLDYDADIINKPEAKAIDIEDFIECYAGLDMDYQDLTSDQSILGMTVFNNCIIPVYDAENEKAKEIPVDKGTVIIDNSLLEENQSRRGRFTLSHELSHWFLHKHIYTETYHQLSLFDDDMEPVKPMIKCRTSDIESSKKELVTDDDWLEWQADYMASALIMPRRSVSKVVLEKFSEMGIKNGVYERGTNFNDDLNISALIYELADIFYVSLSAAEIRLKNLGFLIEPENYQQVLLEQLFDF